MGEDEREDLASICVASDRRRDTRNSGRRSKRIVSHRIRHRQERNTDDRPQDQGAHPNRADEPRASSVSCEPQCVHDRVQQPQARGTPPGQRDDRDYRKAHDAHVHTG